MKYALTCADNRPRVDETDSEDDGVESGIEEVDSDDGIDEGQWICPRHVFPFFWLETRFIPGHMGNAGHAPSDPVLAKKSM